MSDDRVNNYVNSFFNLNSECNFPGGEDLRRQYTMEIYNSQSKGGCQACRRMGIARKFKQIIINRENMENTTNG